MRKLEDNIIKLDNTMKRYNESKKKLRNKIDLLLDPVQSKSTFTVKLQQGEKNFVKFSDEYITKINKNQKLNYGKLSIIGFYLFLLLTFLSCM